MSDKPTPAERESDSGSAQAGLIREIDEDAGGVLIIPLAGIPAGSVVSVTVTIGQAAPAPAGAPAAPPEPQPKRYMGTINEGS